MVRAPLFCALPLTPNPDPGQDAYNTDVYPDGGPLAVMPPPKDLNEACWDDHHGAIAATAEVKAQMGERGDVGCMRSRAIGHCLQGPDDYAFYTRPEATDYDKLYVKRAAILANYCPLSCWNSPFIPSDKVCEVTSEVHACARSLILSDCQVHPQRAWCTPLMMRVVPFLSKDGFESDYKRPWKASTATIIHDNPHISFVAAYHCQGSPGRRHQVRRDSNPSLPGHAQGHGNVRKPHPTQRPLRYLVSS